MGELFGYGSNSPLAENWTIQDSQIFNIGRRDNLFLYCLSASGEPHFLHGVSSSGPWASANLTKEAYNTGTSALPDSLQLLGSLALGFSNNYVYTGIPEGNKDDLVASFSNAGNYTGHAVRIEAEGMEDSAAFVTIGQTYPTWAFAFAMSCYLSSLF